MPAALKSILTASLLLLALGLPVTGPCQDAADQNADLPRFIRCTRISDGQMVLHGRVPPGTQVEFLPLSGSERLTATVLENARYLLAVFDGHVECTVLTLQDEIHCAIFMAVMPPGLPFEDLPLSPVPQGQDPVPEATEVFRVELDQSVANNPYIDGFSAAAASHRHLEQDGVPLDVLLYNVDFTQSDETHHRVQYVAIRTPDSFQTFDLGCDNEVYKLFRLDGVLYLMTDYRCCRCGAEGISIHAFRNGIFEWVYGNGDFST